MVSKGIVITIGGGWESSVLNPDMLDITYLEITKPLLNLRALI